MAINNEYGPHRVVLNQWLECAPFEKMLGIELVKAEDGRSELTMPFLAQFANGGSMLHGGALVTLADTSAVMAIKSVLEPGTHFGTIHMDVTFLHPVMEGIVTARSSVTQVKERLWDATVDIMDSSNTLVVQMKATFKISRRRLAEGC